MPAPASITFHSPLSPLHSPSLLLQEQSGSRKTRMSQCLPAHAAHLEPTARISAHRIGDTLLAWLCGCASKTVPCYSCPSIVSSGLVGGKRLMWLPRSRIKGLKQEHQVSLNSSNLGAFFKHPIQQARTIPSFNTNSAPLH